MELVYIDRRMMTTFYENITRVNKKNANRPCNASNKVGNSDTKSVSLFGPPCRPYTGVPQVVIYYGLYVSYRVAQKISESSLLCGHPSSPHYGSKVLPVRLRPSACF